MIYIFDFQYSDKSYLRYICFTKSGSHSHGIQVSIFLLKISRDSEPFVSFGKMSHILRSKKETGSVSYLTDSTLSLVRTLFSRKPKLLFFSTKTSFVRGGESPCKNLHVSVTSILFFQWHIVTVILLKQFLEILWLVIICNPQCSFVYSIYFSVKATTMEHPN